MVVMHHPVVDFFPITAQSIAFYYSHYVVFCSTVLQLSASYHFSRISTFVPLLCFLPSVHYYNTQHPLSISPIALVSQLVGKEISVTSPHFSQIFTPKLSFNIYFNLQNAPRRQFLSMLYTEKLYTEKLYEPGYLAPETTLSPM